MRVEKWKFAWEFPQLSLTGQTRTTVAWELMKVDISNWCIGKPKRIWRTPQCNVEEGSKWIEEELKWIEQDGGGSSQVRRWRWTLNEDDGEDFFHTKLYNTM